MTTSIGGAVRIGAVNYLNSKPLIEGLLELLPEAELTLDYPSRLADDLEAGRLDVALVPSIEVLRHPNYEVVSDACVATRGPVMSVKLYSRVPFGLIRTLALDAGSRERTHPLVRVRSRADRRDDLGFANGCVHAPRLATAARASHATRRR